MEGVEGVPTRVHQIALGVHDLERATRFYADVMGLPLLGAFDPPGLRFFDLGNVRLLLEHGAPSALVYLEVDDIVTTRARLIAAGVDFVDEPHLIHRDDEGRFGPAGTEEWMSFCRDPEGNLLALVERRH